MGFDLASESKEGSLGGKPRCEHHCNLLSDEKIGR